MALVRTISISLYASLTSTAPTQVEIPFADLPRVLGYAEVADKAAARLWSPAELLPGRTRANDAVRAVHCGVVDLDGPPVVDAERVVSPALVGTSAIVHSTWGNALASADARLRARVIVELSRPVTPQEWPEVWRRLVALLGIPASKRKGADKAAKDPARAYYVPSGPPGARGAAFIYALPGDPLDVDRLLEADWGRLAGCRGTLATLGRIANRLDRRRSGRALAEKVRRLAAGERYADEGERDEATFLLAAELCRSLTGASEAEITQVFAKSVQAMSSDLEPVTLDLVREKVARLWEQSRDEADEGDNAARRRWRTCLSRAGRQTAYDEAELEDLAERLGVSQDELAHAWVLQKGTSYWLLGLRAGLPRYAGPFGTSELPERAEVDLAPAENAGVSAVKVTKGRVSRRMPADLVADHGTVLDAVERHLPLQHATLADGGRILRLAPCPLRDLEPERSESVERWLHALGGPRAAILLDWVACVTRLEEPTAALYLEGAPGTGKTLLAHGLARLWTEGGPAALADAMSDYNDTILRCPLVFGDETIPRDRGGRPRTEELRELIASYRRPLRAKYQPTSDVVGALRVLLAANNHRLLLGGGDLTPEDVEAICQRLVHIPVSPDAAALLRDLGGPRATHAWVEGDEIARHALWLARERLVVPGGRFLVEGRPDALVRSLVTSTGLRATVCHWLVQWLLDPGRLGVGAGQLLAVRDGQVEVSARGLHDRWDLYPTTDMRRPPISRLAAALAGLSQGERVVRVGEASVRHAIVDLEALADWALEHGYASREDLLAAVERLSAAG